MSEKKLEPGDIVQLDCPGNRPFHQRLMIVTTPTTWGAKGYVHNAEHQQYGLGGYAYFRAKTEDMLYVGHAKIWISDEDPPP